MRKVRYSPNLLVKYQTLNLKNEENIIDIIRMMGNWNFELDIDVRDANEFHEIMMKLKNNFPDNIQGYESLLIFKEHKYNFFPQGKRLLTKVPHT